MFFFAFIIENFKIFWLLHNTQYIATQEANLFRLTVRLMLSIFGIDISNLFRSIKYYVWKRFLHFKISLLVILLFRNNKNCYRYLFSY